VTNITGSMALGAVLVIGSLRSFDSGTQLRCRSGTDHAWGRLCVQSLIVGLGYWNERELC